MGATLHRSARASHYRGLSCCGAQAPDAQAQYLWLTGLVAPRHVGSSQTRARTRVPYIGRQIPNHCTTREAQVSTILTPDVHELQQRPEQDRLALRVGWSRPGLMLLQVLEACGHVSTGAAVSS